MTVSLSLPSDLEIEASKLNSPLDEYILRILSLRSFLPNPPKNGAELVAYWESVGVIGSRPDITDSQKYAQEIRNRAETRSGSIWVKVVS